MSKTTVIEKVLEVIAALSYCVYKRFEMALAPEVTRKQNCP